MGTWIYYTATRATALSDDEREVLDRIVAEQNAGFPFDYEVLSLSPETPQDVLLQGSVKIKITSETLASIVYWCAALSEMRRTLPDAQWSVRLEEAEIPWTDDGYGFPELDGLTDKMFDL
ncbi:MAG: pilus assembly protein PilM [Micrococcales bacterium]|nr:pilus assembly protein PilM [Micrococcales bacterium]MCL2667691.1 pilus assembly protein PilM [Micrococcales bacterium]